MKTAIIYYSKHHGNTKKLLDAIVAKYPDVDLLDVTLEKEMDLSTYDRIGFASGIYYSKFHKEVLRVAKENLSDNKQTFFIYTYGAKKNGYTKAITDAVKIHNSTVLGEYGCFGFDTYGPFKLLGGMAKGHPNDCEIEDAVKFYEGL